MDLGEEKEVVEIPVPEKVPEKVPEPEKVPVEAVP